MEEAQILMICYLVVDKINHNNSANKDSKISLFQTKTTCNYQATEAITLTNSNQATEATNN